MISFANEALFDVAIGVILQSGNYELVERSEKFSYYFGWSLLIVLFVANILAVIQVKKAKD